MKNNFIYQICALFLAILFIAASCTNKEVCTPSKANLLHGEWTGEMTSSFSHINSTSFETQWQVAYVQFNDDFTGQISLYRLVNDVPIDTAHNRIFDYLSFSEINAIDINYKYHLPSNPGVHWDEAKLYEIIVLEETKLELHFEETSISLDGDTIRSTEHWHLSR